MRSLGQGWDGVDWSTLSWKGGHGNWSNDAMWARSGGPATNIPARAVVCSSNGANVVITSDAGSGTRSLMLCLGNTLDVGASLSVGAPTSGSLIRPPLPPLPLPLQAPVVPSSPFPLEADIPAAPSVPLPPQPAPPPCGPGVLVLDAPANSTTVYVDSYACGLQAGGTITIGSDANLTVTSLGSSGRRRALASRQLQGVGLAVSFSPALVNSYAAGQSVELQVIARVNLPLAPPASPSMPRSAPTVHTTDTESAPFDPWAWALISAGATALCCAVCCTLRLLRRNRLRIRRPPPRKLSARAIPSHLNGFL